MEMRPLGTSGMTVAALSLGAMNFNGRTDPATSKTMLLTALDAGMNLVDTADIYSAGGSESLLGEVLSQSGRRDATLIATKCGMHVGPTVNDSGSSRRHIVRSCENSLRRLRTDRIDLYQLHRPSFVTAPEETMAAFDQLVRDGKVVAVGSSTHPAWLLMECRAVSSRYGWAQYASEQSPYNLLDRRIENELVPFARRHGVAILPWSPIAGGILAGRYRTASTAEPGSRAEILPALRDRITPRALEVAAAVRVLAEKLDLTPGQLALLWLRDQPGVTSPIVGPRTPGQLEEFLAVADLAPLGAETLTALDELVPPGTHVADFHNSSRWMGGVARAS
jgi:aryl-alcohol dehydrogenase-like predicted oxidoreductase